MRGGEEKYVLCVMASILACLTHYGLGMTRISITIQDETQTFILIYLIFSVLSLFLSGFKLNIRRTIIVYTMSSYACASVIFILKVLISVNITDAREIIPIVFLSAFALPIAYFAWIPGLTFAVIWSVLQRRTPLIAGHKTESVEGDF